MSDEQTNLIAKLDLKYWADKTATKLLCNAILRWEIRILQRIGLRFLKEQGSLLSTIIAMLVLTAFLYWSTTAINKIIDSAALWNLAILFASFLTAFALSIVKYLHDTILSEDEENFANEIISAVYNQDDESYTELRDWWRSFLELRWQVPSVLVVGALGVAITFLLKNTVYIDIHDGSFLLMFCCGVAIGQGGYCALRIPRVASILRTMPMELFWLNPSNTRWIRQASWVFTKLALANALIGTCILVGFLLLKPWASRMTLSTAVLLLLITWAVVLYSFLYPHYHLGRIISAEKSRQLDNLQGTLDSLAKTPNTVSENDIRGMFEIIRVYDQIESARSGALNTQAIFGLILSLGAPLLSFVVLLIEKLSRSAGP